MKILVTVGDGEVKESFFTPAAKAALEELGEVEYNAVGRQAFTKEELITHIRDVDILVTGWQTPRVDEDVLKAANRLKIHAHTGGTVATMVCKEEYDRGIIVLSGNDLFAKSVAEGALAYTLLALRKLDEEIASMRNGGWRRIPSTNSHPGQPCHPIPGTGNPHPGGPCRARVALPAQKAGGPGRPDGSRRLSDLCAGERNASVPVYCPGL